MHRNLPTIAFVLAASLGGCKKKDAPKSDSTPAAAEAPKAAPGAIDAKIVAAAKKVTTDCKWNEEGYYPYDCPAKQAWDQQHFDKDAAPTLVSLLADKSPGVQWLAASSLYHDAWLVGNKDLQDKVLAAAAALPKDLKGGTANMLGRTIGFADVPKTGLFDKVKSIVENPNANEALRVGIVNWLLAGNQDSEPVYALTRDQAQNGASPAIKIAALVALSAAYNKHDTAEMCKLWLDALPSLEDKQAAIIAAHLTNGDLQVNNQNDAFPYNWAMISSDNNKCAPEVVDAAIKDIAKRIADGKAEDYWWTTAIKGLGRSKNATDAQKQQAVALAKQYAENAKLPSYQRGEAIEVLVDIDPATAKSLADKYAADKDLKDAAGRVQKKLAEKKS